MDLPGARVHLEGPGQSADRLVDAAGDLRSLGRPVEVVNAQRFEVISGGELRAGLLPARAVKVLTGPGEVASGVNHRCPPVVHLATGQSGQEYPRLGPHIRPDLPK